MLKRRALTNLHDSESESESDSSELLEPGRLEDISDEGEDDGEEEEAEEEATGPPWKCGACPSARLVLCALPLPAHVSRGASPDRGDAGVPPAVKGAPCVRACSWPAR